jgi:hypothetical protein
MSDSFFVFKGFHPEKPLEEGTENIVIVEDAGRQTVGVPFAVLPSVAEQLRTAPDYYEEVADLTGTALPTQAGEPKTETTTQQDGAQSGQTEQPEGSSSETSSQGSSETSETESTETSSERSGDATDSATAEGAAETEADIGSADKKPAKTTGRK